MVNDITIVNLVTNASIDMHRGSGSYVLDEIDWDSPAVSFSSYRVPFQVGSNLSGVTVETRKPTIIGYVIADLSGADVLGMTIEQYYRYQMEQIEQSKSYLNKLVSIYQDVEIRVDGYYLRGRPTMPVKYSIEEEENNEVLCMFEMEIECFDPMFSADSKTVYLASASPMFHFPMVSTEQKGDLYSVFGEIVRRRSMEVTNDGDSETGCEIKVFALGGIEDPRVYNVNTGEYIEFEGVTLSTGDTLTISTVSGEERAVHHIASSGVDRSVVGNIANGSTFFTIAPGTGLYAYEVPEGQENNVEISISFTEKYFNLVGM